MLRLEHNRIVPLYGISSSLETKEIHIIMPFYQLGSLKSYIRQNHNELKVTCDKWPISVATLHCFLILLCTLYLLLYLYEVFCSKYSNLMCELDSQELKNRTSNIFKGDRNPSSLAKRRV